MMRPALVFIVLFISQSIMAQRNGQGFKTMNDSVFETGDYILFPELTFNLSGGLSVSKESLDSLNKVVVFLTENENLKVTISNHTDQRGNDQSNQKLSQMRAERIIEYLVFKGVSASRLLGHGAGESEPIATDELISNAQSEKEREELYRMNRRTEMIVQ